MATILKFKIPTHRRAKANVNANLISTSVNDAMLIIHHALHGSDKDCRPKDHQLAAQLLDELSSYIKSDIEDDCLVLSQLVSGAIVERYPEAHQLT
jgi:hypothetical protein